MSIRQSNRQIASHTDRARTSIQNDKVIPQPMHLHEGQFCIKSTLHAASYRALEPESSVSSSTSGIPAQSDVALEIQVFHA
ncbi:MAG: multicopper oxidase domain-containing protein [Paracoccaceae bacterium]